MRLSSLVGYIISKLTDMEASFAKTKLVKLIYLIDVEYYRRGSRKLTNVEWTFHYYGPYASEIDEALKQLDLDIPQEERLTAAGHRAIVFRPSWDVDAEFEAEASTLQKLVVDRVLDDWGMEDLNPILSYVYFHTEPMRDAERGEILDFSKIKRLPALGITKPLREVSANRQKEMRAKFEKVRAERKQTERQPLRPKPRIDDVFWYSLQHLEDGEEYSVPHGDIELTEEFKGQLRGEAE